MLSIIIVHYRTPELLRLCLKNLKRVIAKDNLETEVLIIDSGATDDSKNWIIFEFPEFKYFPFKENLGFAKGVNRGIDNSKGDFILITQPDVIVTEKSIEPLINYLKANPKVGLIGPKLLNFDGTVQRSFFKFPKLVTLAYRRTFLKNLSFAKKELLRFEYSDKLTNNPELEPFEVDWLMGAVLATSRKAVEKVGGMDEKIFMYFEDVDWARRFWQKDYKVICYPKVAMYHWLIRASSSFLGILDPIFNKQTRIHIKSALYYFLKWKKLKYQSHKT
ncbi:MAG: glycosyltransferase family 2 protein [Parcubacteria group bacterium]|nr:glycosyltransferase family 2 protein [Parcubacteria group bacterium]